MLGHVILAWWRTCSGQPGRSLVVLASRTFGHNYTSHARRGDLYRCSRLHRWGGAPRATRAGLCVQLFLGARHQLHRFDLRGWLELSALPLQRLTACFYLMPIAGTFWFASKSRVDVLVEPCPALARRFGYFQCKHGVAWRCIKAAAWFIGPMSQLIFDYQIALRQLVDTVGHALCESVSLVRSTCEDLDRVWPILRAGRNYRQSVNQTATKWHFRDHRIRLW